ncbi:MAG: hypothetical protein V4702_05960 [Patescibacteria group bacterium]
MPVPVYYDEKERSAGNNGQHDDLGVNPADRQAEIANLENAYNRPSPGPNSQNNELDASQLQNAEQSADSYSGTAAAQREGDQLGNGYTGGGLSPLALSLATQLAKKGLRAKYGDLSRAKKIFILSSISSVIVAVAFFVALIVMGPLKLIHAAQMLQKFHFGAVESYIEGRTARIYRYYKWQDKPQNRRLSRIGNNLADKIETRYAKAGMELEFDGRGFMKKIRVDTTKFPADDLAKLRQDFNVRGAVDATNKLVEIDVPENFNARQTRALFDRTRGSLGLTGFGSFIQTRLVANRISPSMFHPIKKIDEKLVRNTGDAYTRWKERKRSIISGDERIRIRGSPNATDENGNPKPNPGADAAGTVDGAGNVDPDLTGRPRVESVKTNVRSGLATAGAVNMVTGLICMVYTLATVASDAEYQNVVQPSERVGGYQLGLGGQLQSTDKSELQAVQVGFESDQMYDESNDNDPTTEPSSFFEARSIQTELGQNPIGPDTPNSAKLGGSNNILTQLQEDTPETGQWLLSKGCGVVNSPIGMAFTFGIDLFLAPASAVVGFGASMAAGPLLNDLAKYVAGEEISEDLAGATLGSVSNQGAFFLADQQFLTMAATPLSEGERTVLRSQTEAEHKHYADEAPWTERYFSLANTDSLMSGLARINISNPTKTMARLVDIPAAFGSLTKLFGARALAQQPQNYDYGLPKFAYRPSELERADTDESFSNPYVNASIIDAQIPELHNKYSEKCFGLKFDDQEKFQLSQLVNMKKIAEAPDYAECRSTDPTFVRYRFYVGDLMTHITAACYEGDNEACEEIGVGANGGGQTSSTPTIPPTQPAGNVQELAKQLLTNPRVTYWTNKGVNTRDVIVALSEGKPAYTTCANATNKTTEVNPKILQFLVDAGQQTNIMVNALTDKCHTDGSKHYIGMAVDLDLQSGPLSIIIPIATKYGGKKNSETNHHHFDFTVSQ